MDSTVAVTPIVNLAPDVGGLKRRMKMKKLISLIVTLLLVLVMMGCGSDGSDAFTAQISTEILIPYVLTDSIEYPLGGGTRIQLVGDSYLWLDPNRSYVSETETGYSVRIWE